MPPSEIKCSVNMVASQLLLRQQKRQLSLTFLPSLSISLTLTLTFT